MNVSNEAKRLVPADRRLTCACTCGWYTWDRPCLSATELLYATVRKIDLTRPSARRQRQASSADQEVMVCPMCIGAALAQTGPAVIAVVSGATAAKLAFSKGAVKPAEKEAVLGKRSIRQSVKPKKQT